MKKYFAILFAMCVLLRSASAHRLDEYLQATILTLRPNGVGGIIRLVPGVAVAPAVLRDMQVGADGTLSVGQQQQLYAERVLADIRLRLDGQALTPHLLSYSFPSPQTMLQGTGEVQIAFEASVHISKGRHGLQFENRHVHAMSVYLVNLLQPDERELQVEAQTRSPDQAHYDVIFDQRKGATSRRLYGWSGFEGAFLLGVRHIAEGTDHLLFLLTLLLAAPLVAQSGRWSHHATIRHCLVRVLQIVSAFTLGHSLTLALAVLGVIRLASEPVEVLIAVSILLSAIHALRPLFPGHEAAIAASFGLIHGLAFASALEELGMGGWYRLVSLFGFNLGIEAMQVFVVAATLPSLLLWSRVRSYRWCRMTGGCVAALTSCAWIFERMTQRTTGATTVVEQAAKHGMVMAGGLLLLAIMSWAHERSPHIVVTTSPSQRSHVRLSKV